MLPIWVSKHLTMRFVHRRWRHWWGLALSPFPSDCIQLDLSSLPHGLVQPGANGTLLGCGRLILLVTTAWRFWNVWNWPQLSLSHRGESKGHSLWLRGEMLELLTLWDVFMLFCPSISYGSPKLGVVQMVQKLLTTPWLDMTVIQWYRSWFSSRSGLVGLWSGSVGLIAFSLGSCPLGIFPGRLVHLLHLIFWVLRPNGMAWDIDDMWGYMDILMKYHEIG